MGIIAPICFITLRLLKRRKALGYELLILLLFVCSIVSIMVLLQTAFQTAAGIVLPIAALITKVDNICDSCSLFNDIVIYRIKKNT